MKDFIKAIAFLGGIIGQVYITEFTGVPRLLCHLIAVVIAAAIAVIMGGTSGDIRNVFHRDEKTGTWVSLTWGVFAIMSIGLQVFTFIAYSER
jgi:hypothetical protein